MSDDTKPVALHIIEQGAVRVNCAYVHREAPGIVCIYVDLHSKRAWLSAAGGDPPCLYLDANEHTLHVDESVPRNAMTLVELPEYAGWDVFACDGPARYTLAVVLVRT